MAQFSMSSIVGQVQPAGMVTSAGGMYSAILGLFFLSVLTGKSLQFLIEQLLFRPALRLSYKPATKQGKILEQWLF